MVSIPLEVSPWTIRMAVLAVIVVSLFTVTGGFATVVGADENVYEKEQDLPAGERHPLAGKRAGATVVTFSGNGPMVVLNRNGTMGYYTDAFDSFWDVDPVPGTRWTVIVGASDEYDVDECPGRGACTRNYVLRWNLSTGERVVLVDRFRPSLVGSEWHDVDAVDADRDGDALIVADIEQSRVMWINTTDGHTTWSYSLQRDYSLESGGSWPGGSWSHLNDVEVTPDGRVMVSLRNHDSVVFIDPDGTLNESMTLGSDDRHDVLNEQHNPDFIPSSDGGPAVVVADSQNNRLVEYHREDGEWVRSWIWQDGRMRWPRDADRLPNGHTLVTDTNANRIVEVNTSGAVVWSHSTPPALNPYEAERLGTGDESRGGPSARAAGIVSRQAGRTNEGSGGAGLLHRPGLRLWIAVKNVVPNKLLNAFLFVKPAWLTTEDVPVLFIVAASVAALLVFEASRLSVRVSVRNPFVVERK